MTVIYRVDPITSGALAKFAVKGVQKAVKKVAPKIIRRTASFQRGATAKGAQAISKAERSVVRRAASKTGKVIRRNKGKTALGVGTGLVGLSATPAAGGIASLVSSETDNDIVDVKNSLRNADNLYDVFHILKTRDQMRELGIGKDYTEGNKIILDVNDAVGDLFNTEAWANINTSGVLGYTYGDNRYVFSPSRIKRYQRMYDEGLKDENLDPELRSYWEAQRDTMPASVALHELAHVRQAHNDPDTFFNYSTLSQKGTVEGYASGLSDQILRQRTGRDIYNPYPTPSTRPDRSVTKKEDRQFQKSWNNAYEQAGLYDPFLTQAPVAFNRAKWYNPFD